MAERQDKIGKRLKRLRELAGISQAEAGHAAGIHREHLCMIEKGYRNISPEDAAKIESYLQRVISRRARELTSALADSALHPATA